MGFSSTTTAGNIESSSKLLMSSSTTLTELLNSGVDGTSTATTTSRSLGDRIADRTGCGIPKFKSLPPPSLPISPPSPNWVSPSSYFAIPPGLSPAQLLDSPVLLSSSTLLPSPTTGAFAAQALNWNTNHRSSKQEDVNKYSDFTFQTQARPSDVPSSTFATDQMLRGGQNPNHNHNQQQQQQSSWNLREENKQKDASSMKSMVKSEFPTNEAQGPASGEDQNSCYQPCQLLYAREQKKSEDGYNWRKYGQKQVKGSENPRSYYKCTYPNCPMKKKIERSLEGQITEIVYKGSHNHPKPVNTRRSSSSSSSAGASLPHYCNDFQDHSLVPHPQGSSGQTDSVATPENSSISVVDDELDMASQRSRSAGDDDEPDSKRWKGEGENECMSAAPGTRAVREPRVVVQTKSDIDILDDGYRWRKYGQKVVKGNPNPRSYYKCTHPGCPVRKHVERAAQDLGAVITTYEGKHNHEVPAARGSGMNRVLASSGTALAANSMHAAITRPSALNYGNPRPQSSNVPPLIPLEIINQRRDMWASSMEGEAQAQAGGGGVQLSPFTLEMLQNPTGFSGFRNQYTDMFTGTRTKDEPKEDISSFDSFLY